MCCGRFKMVRLLVSVLDNTFFMINAKLVSVLIYVNDLERECLMISIESVVW